MSRSRRVDRLQVRAGSQTLRAGGDTLRCAIGKGGYREHKSEGDHCTPLGAFPLRALYYRPDRITLPDCVQLPVIPITETMGWCDAPEHPAYNQPVTLPFSASHELLWRDDHRYDVMIPLGYNDDPVRPGLGSAIFFHLATDDYQGTEGCVAIALADMLQLLPRLSRDTLMEIRP